MAAYLYHGNQSYGIFGEESAWGTAVVPTGGANIDHYDTISFDMDNGRGYDNALGESNLTQVHNGNVEITGSVEGNFSNASFLQYIVGGNLIAGADGDESDPNQLRESTNFGYAETETPSLSLEIGRLVGGDSDVMVLDGLTFPTGRIGAAAGEKVKYSYDFRARNAVTSTTAETISNPTAKPFNFVEGTWKFGSDAVLRIRNFEISFALDYDYSYNLTDGRLLEQPVWKKREYTFTLGVTHSVDDAATSMDGVELRELLYGAAASTTFDTTGTPDEAGNIELVLTKGTGDSDPTATIQLEGAYIDKINEPINLDGKIVFSVTGHAVKGLTDTGQQIPVEYYDHSVA